MYTLLSAWLCVFFIMLFFWLIYLKLKNPGVIDVAWAIAITASSLTYLIQGSDSLTWSQITLVILLLLWCIRLSGYLFIYRILPGHVDKRYIAISQEWKLKKIWGFLLNYQFQGLLSLVIAIPFWYIADLGPLTPVLGLGIGLVTLGIIGESFADLQLLQFKRNHPGQVCDKKLWAYSRHPNYCFEIIVWIGFGLAAASSRASACIAFLSPLLLYLLMRYVTGPITEKGSLESKGDAYKKYQQKTPMIFPW